MSFVTAALLLAPALALPPQEAGDDGSTQPTPEEIFEARIAYTRQFAERLEFEEGSVALASGEAAFALPEGWAFLQARDARRVVEDLWDNPPDPTTIGFIDPPAAEGRLQSDYGIIVSMELDGFIEDDDAADLDYGEMLESLQEGARAANPERIAAGYNSLELVGWAEPPHYDSASKKLYWAKELAIGDYPENTLNYDVRVLGRRGALVLQAVAPMSAFDEVQEGMKVALAATSFNEGHRYSDFDPGMDKVAAYGIGGLIAGKMAAKVGFFAVIAKFGKLIVVAVIGAFVALKRFVFGGKDDANPYASQDEVEPEPAE
ncbi:MAG: DUF2167 domain-containing protein [Planctomycetota bacterium]